MVDRVPLYAVFGHPIGHSLSPRIHNRAFSACDVSAFYLPVDCPPGQLAAKLDAFVVLGGVGVNLTRPLKEEVLPLVSGRSDRWTRRAGAANTLVWQESGWFAANTDCEALYRALARVSPASRTALILGSGGAARASAAVLQELGYRVAAAARRPSLCDFAEERLLWEDRLEPTSWGVVVNATPVGQMAEDAADRWPLPETDGVAVDWVYRPNATVFLSQARAQGIETVDGLSLLVEQAALGWNVWFGREGPRDVMHEAVGAWR